MCSIGEDDFGDDGGIHGMVPDQKELYSSTNEQLGDCKKCGVKNIKVYKLFFRSNECRDCFLANARHKFRATLGSSKVLPRDAQVLLVFDGSSEAIVLLDMLYYAQTQKNFKRLHCTVCVLHIDETALHADDEKRTQHVLALQAHLKAYPAFPTYITSICNTAESNLLKLHSTAQYSECDKQIEEEFVKNFKAIRSLTSRQDYLKYHRNHIIETTAVQLDCAYVFLPDISTTLATQLLTAISLGRGGSAAFDVALVDERLANNVKLVRPMRDLNHSEIDLYLELQNLTPLKRKKEFYGVDCGAGASLQNLTSAFVENLQENYSSTVSTVFRSCDKIAPKTQLRRDLSNLSLYSENSNNSISVDWENCTLCKSPLENKQTHTLLAIEFSRLVSEKGTNENSSTDLDKTARQNLKRMNDEKSLCHACLNIEKDCLTNVLAFKT